MTGCPPVVAEPDQGNVASQGAPETEHWVELHLSMLAQQEIHREASALLVWWSQMKSVKLILHKFLLQSPDILL